TVEVSTPKRAEVSPPGRNFSSFTYRSPLKCLRSELNWPGSSTKSTLVQHPVQPGPQTDLLRTGAADDHHLVVDIDLDARVIDLDDQRPLGCLDPQDRGDEVRDLAQSRRLRCAQARQGQQD